MTGMLAGNERRNRIVALVLAAVLLGGVILAFLASVALAGPAGAAPAHASLVSVVPADGARLDSPPPRIVLTFDESISPALAQVRLTRDGMPVETSAPTGDRTVVTVSVTPPGRPGAYRLVWQVVSDDGHPVSGESSFTVGGAVAGAPTPKVTPTYKTPQTQRTTFGHPDHMPGLVVAGVLLLGGVALLVYEHRRRKAQDHQRIS